MTSAPDTAAPLVVSTTEEQRIVVVAAEAAELEAVAKKLRGMAAFGHRVILVWLDGEPGHALSSFRARVPLAPASSRGVRERVLHAATTAPWTWLRSRDTLATALAQDPRAARVLAGADAVVPVGAQAWAIVDRLVGKGRALVSTEELTEWEHIGGMWRRLRRRVAAGPGSLDPRYVARLIDRITALGEVPEEHQEMLVPLISSLHATGHYEQAQRLCGYLRETGSAVDDVERALRRGLSVLVETSVTGQEPSGLRPAVAEVVAAADMALAAEDVDRASAAATLALQLLFHRELHADGTSSPLVEEPDDFLADWRGSRVGQLLGGPTPRRPALRRSAVPSAHPHETGRPRVVVAPGSYAQFARPVIEALEERADVVVVELAAQARLRGLGTRPELVDARLRQALGEEGVPDYELLEELEAADALFVDWADRGALAAVMSAPEGLRVVLRIHSMDAFSPWIHLIDWSRVDDLVFVSDHLRDMVVRLLGDRLATTRIHVVANVLDPSRLPTHKTEGHLRRLLMVGWAQRVKDPLWALEVLARLRQDDPTWRLTLVGADFPTSTIASQTAYARDFWDRMAQDDVRGAVDFVGFTRELAPHLAAAGFVLSTSRRESFGLGLVEGAASGAVPVVRNWPIFASLDGARGLFPQDWVVDTVEDAARRIREHAEEPEWSGASQAARDTVEERFASTHTRTRFQEIVLG